MADRASTFLNSEGKEVFIDEDDDGYSVPEPTVTSDDEDDDEPEDDLIDLPSLDDPLTKEEEEDELDLPEEEKVNEPDAKFGKYFEEQTGMPMKEFGETLHEIRTIIKELGVGGLTNGVAFIKAAQQAQQIEEGRSEVDKIWGVSREETLKRLEKVKERWDRMSPKEQKLYDTPQGADIIWRSIEARSSSTKTQTSKSGKNPAGRRYAYTQAQIEAMSKEEYAAQADKITEAYRKNLVEY